MARSGELPFVIYRIWKGEKSSYTHGSQIWPPFRTCSDRQTECRLYRSPISTHQAQNCIPS